MIRVVRLRPVFSLLPLLLLSHCIKVSIPATAPPLPSYSPQNMFYTKVFSVGAKVDRDANTIPETGYVADLCEGSSDCIRIDWSPVTVPDFSGEIQYSVYRRKKGENEFSNKITTTSLTYIIDTDPAIIGGQSYLYQVSIELDGQEYRGHQYFPEIEIVKPEANLAFIHRWMVNLDVCSQMGRGPNQPNGLSISDNYRCPFNGFGSTEIDGETFFDFATHLIVDRFENSCHFTKSACAAHDPGDGSTTTDCIGSGDPNTDTINGSLNAVFYRKGSRHCYINTDGGTTWVQLASATPAQQALMVQNFAKEPAVSRLNQPLAQSLCQNRNVEVDGLNYSMKLGSRRAFMAYSSWDGNLSDTEITDLEAGLNTSGNCNTDTGHGLAWDNTYPPPNKDFLGGSSSNGVFSTASDETNYCVSRYGVQDLVGNLYEWTSDQIDSSQGVVSVVDPTNDWFDGILFNGQIAPSTGSLIDIDNFQYLNVPLGIPLICNLVAPTDPLPACNSDDLLVPITSQSFHGDRYWLGGAANRGSLVGGLWADGTSAGRFRFAFDQSRTSHFPGAGSRCISEIPTN